jgi:hypothetical protein
MANPPEINASANARTELRGPSLVERVKQLRDSYLNSVYAVDYYKESNDRTTQYARHFDFAIGLGAVTSGGSGLGILGDTRLAWLCGTWERR